jgi:hypothetical protein
MQKNMFQFGGKLRRYVKELFDTGISSCEIFPSPTRVYKVHLFLFLKPSLD